MFHVSWAGCASLADTDHLFVRSTGWLEYGAESRVDSDPGVSACLHLVLNSLSQETSVYVMFEVHQGSVHWYRERTRHLGATASCQLRSIVSDVKAFGWGRTSSVAIDLIRPPCTRS
jgi:hypothetical protein